MKITKLYFLILIIVIFFSFNSACTYQADSVIIKDDSTKNLEIDDTGLNLKNLLEKVVVPPVITSHDPNEVIYSSGEKDLVFLKGHAMPENTIDVYVNGLLKKESLEVDSQGSFEVKDGVEVVEGKNSIKVIAEDASGRQSEATAFNLFLMVPESIDYSIYNSDEELKEIKDIYYTKEREPSAYIRGSYLPSTDIFLEVNGKVIKEIISDENGIFTFADIELEQGENEIAVWGVIEGDRTSSPKFKNILVTKDSSSPNPVSLTGYSDDTGNNLSWTTSIDENFYSYKLVRVSDPCLNPEYAEHDVIATINDVALNNYTDTEIIEGQSYYYTLWTLDKAGNTISSNVLALPKPIYSISIEKIPPFENNTIGRREWYYQYFEITNTGNVIVDLQPIMVWIKLDPEPDIEEIMWPLWEAHIWDADSGNYYYSNEFIEKTHVSDYWAVDGISQTTVTIEEDEDARTITEEVVTRRTEETEGKRLMETTIETTITEIDLVTGDKEVEEQAPDTSTSLVGPEQIGSAIENIEPGEKIKIAVKIQNISASEGDKITCHFHFAPVDCDGYFFTDEEVSTTDITVVSSGRN